MKNKHKKFLALLLLLEATAALVHAQTLMEGYVFEQNNRGYLNQVKVTVFKLGDSKPVVELETDHEGYFTATLTPGKYRVLAEKDIFFEKADTINVGKDKAFVRLELRRRPGYLFDATLAEVRESPDQLVDAIQGATIEIYNRTADRPELVIEDDKDAFFQFTFERGNHYTMLIRKEGYLSKRIEVYVNVNGCIICVDGVRDVSPGVTDNLTSGNEMGTLLANIELDKAKIDKRIQIQNIYYDYDKWDIRPDAAERLDNVVVLMRDNPGLSVELGSHTDSRGNDDYNETLSQKRAQAAVAYIISQGIDSLRITAKGYGEKALVNRCGNGVDCSEAEHQQNRRTELRITGIASNKFRKSLAQIILDEAGDRLAKGKTYKPKANEKQLPEANNSVKLERAPAAAINEPVARTQEVPEPVSIAYEYGNVRILQLPAGFKGCAVELTRSKLVELGADNPVFKGQQQIFHLQEADGAHAYFIVNLGPRDAATEFYKKKIKSTHPNAHLVLFGENGKEYLN